MGGRVTRTRSPRQRQTVGLLTDLSMLRRPHANHRDLRARLPANPPAISCLGASPTPEVSAHGMRSLRPSICTDSDMAARFRASRSAHSAALMDELPLTISVEHGLDIVGRIAAFVAVSLL